MKLEGATRMRFLTDIWGHNKGEIVNISGFMPCDFDKTKTIIIITNSTSQTKKGIHEAHTKIGPLQVVELLYKDLKGIEKEVDDIESMGYRYV